MKIRMKVGPNGEVILPKDFMELLNIKPGGEILIEIRSNEIAIRSLSENKWKSFVEKADLKYIENKQRKIYLCKNHYKESNKYRKSQDKLYQKKGFLDDSVSEARVKRYD